MKKTAFLFSISAIILLSGAFIASPVLATDITIRALGTTGSETIRLVVGGSMVTSWTITTSMADYTATTDKCGYCRVYFTNDVNERSVQIDYVIVDGNTYQAEDQATNTGCSSSYSEWLYCNGYIDFGTIVACRTLSVSPASLSISAEANSIGTFDIISDTDWTVSSNQSWLVPSPVSGFNNATITVTAQANVSLVPRTATVTISGTSVPSKTITVTQFPVLSVSPTWLVIAAQANATQMLDITASRNWTVSSNQSWLTAEPTSGITSGTVTLSAEENTGSSTRTATVTVSVEGVSQNITVIQMYHAQGECNIIPPMPPFSGLTVIPKFPDPFVFMDGTRVTTRTQWKCRRAEIAALVQEFELGYMQYTPYSATTSSFSSNAITVTVNDNNTSISFSCSISYPTVGSPPYPAMIGMNGSFLNNTELRNMGVAIITFPSDQIAQQNSASSRGIGKFYDMYGSGHSAGALMAWAWGVDRLIDALEKTPEANIDPTRLGVTGCSRNGKGALIAGAFCDRIKLTIPQESGSGGAASWRVSNWQGPTVQTLGQIVTENCWFRANFNQFANDDVNKLPFDHHMVAGLCAPDALLFIENSAMVWLGNISTWTNGNVTHKIWEALGVPDKMGYSSVSHGDHCGFPSSQQPEVTAYVQKFLVGGGTADTNVMRYPTPSDYNESRWVDWSVPDLRLPGDFAGSVGVDFADFAVLANAWLSDPGQGNWNGLCDISQPADNLIDIYDLDVLTSNWLGWFNTRRPKY